MGSWAEQGVPHWHLATQVGAAEGGQGTRAHQDQSRWVEVGGGFDSHADTKQHRERAGDHRIADLDRVREGYRVQTVQTPDLESGNREVWTRMSSAGDRAVQNP